MQTSTAQEILKQMALTRNTTVDAILREFAKHNINGQVVHFWPDENTACQVILFEQSILCG